MAPRSALAVVSVAVCTQTCIGASVSSLSLRGRHHHAHHHLRLDGEAVSSTPLYDDFLDIMSHAPAKALSEERSHVAYEDFLHLMKGRTEKAYDELPHVWPSYDDFMRSLKESRVEADKTPVPQYEDFLRILKEGATKAMNERQSYDLLDQQKGNPLDRMMYGKDGKAKEQKKEEGDDDESKLRAELRRLQEERKKHGDKVPDHKKKPLMKRINVLRTQLCWKRPNLWEHEKCLRFLGIHCMKESTGEGICRAFTKKAGEKCKTSNHKLKEDYCALAEALDDTYGEDEESEEAIEHEEAIEGNEGGDEVVEEDEELDQELDKELMGDGDDLDKDLIEGGDKAGKGAEGADKQKDTDGDGVIDSEDAFPDDPNEWKDTDKDGIGDNADDDIDGDGHKNAVDAFPTDPKEFKDSDGDGIGDNSDKDRDNDGVENDKDKFPDDPTEWLDSDKDGVGDNKDAFPFNPNCHSPLEPCIEAGNSTKMKKGGPQDPATLDMSALRPLPDQGFNEHMDGPPVNHENYYSWVGDWQEEWPEMEHPEKATLADICRDHPNNKWCRRLHSGDSHFR